MIAVTFIAGLLPVIGNLISNTVIVTLSCRTRWRRRSVAGVPVVIHKLEYFVNARIVGTRSARARGDPGGMLVMEAASDCRAWCGAIYYGYLKNELSARGLV